MWQYDELDNHIILHVLYPHLYTVNIYKYYGNFVTTLRHNYINLFPLKYKFAQKLAPRYLNIVPTGYRIGLSHRSRDTVIY